MAAVEQPTVATLSTVVAAAVAAIVAIPIAVREPACVHVAPVVSSSTTVPAAAQIVEEAAVPTVPAAAQIVEEAAVPTVPATAQTVEEAAVPAAAQTIEEAAVPAVPAPAEPWPTSAAWSATIKAAMPSAATLHMEHQQQHQQQPYT